MDQIVLGEEEEEEEVDIEEGNIVISERLSFDDNDLINPLIGEDEDEDEKQRRRRRRRSSQSLDLSDKKFDNSDNVLFNNKFKKTIRKSSKPPRPPRGPLLSANDQKLMKEISELAMRKRARIERMKTLRRLKSSKSSSNPCSSVLAMIVTVIFFVFLIFQGFFTSNASLNSDNSPAPTVSANGNNNRMVSVQFYNEFAPRERIDPSPTTSFRRKRVSGADNEENTRDVTR